MGNTMFFLCRRSTIVRYMSLAGRNFIREVSSKCVGRVETNGARPARVFVPVGSMAVERPRASVHLANRRRRLLPHHSTFKGDYVTADGHNLKEFRTSMFCTSPRRLCQALLRLIS